MDIKQIFTLLNKAGSERHNQWSKSLWVCWNLTGDHLSISLCFHTIASAFQF